MAEKRIKRPRDPIALAKLIGDIATRQVEDRPALKHTPSGESARAAGERGGRARAEKLTKKRRKEIAAAAAKARWKEKEHA